MATSAFKSTSRRSTQVNGGSTISSSSSKLHRRTRSLSRVSHRLPTPESSSTTAATPKGKFVNTTRGSEFSDVSLDELALELFASSSPIDSSNDEAITRQGRSIGRWANDTASSFIRRGRSISRQNNNNSNSNCNNNNNFNSSNINNNCSRRRRSVSVVRNRISDSEGNANHNDNQGMSGDGKSSSSNNCGGKVVQNSSRRRRSLSVARNQISDSESDRDLSLSYGRHGNLKDLVAGRNQMSSSLLRAPPNGRRLERSLSLKDLPMLNDGYSSQSSVVTDEEPRNSRQDKFGTEKTIHTVYAQKMKEHPTDEISSGLYEAMKKVIRHAVEGIRTELEQSEKSKQDLVLEERHGRDSSKHVKEIVTDSKNAAASQRPGRTRKRSNDRTRMSSKLVEEAEKYFVDFISNVEDTDISSFDGERSDGSSTLGCTSRARGGTNYTEAENIQSPAVPLGTDGVILPWLQWESSNDASSLRKSIAQTRATPTALKFDAEEEVNFVQDPSYHSASSRGSSTSNLFSSHPITTKEDEEVITGASRRSQFDMDEYLQLQKKEDHLFETYKERHRISCGGLLLCAGGL